MSKNRIALTSKGVIHKRIIQKLEPLIGLQPSDVDGLNLHYVHADVYPSSLAVVLDLLLALDLAGPKQGVWKLNMHALKEWLLLSREAMERIILRYMIERYVSDSAENQHYAFRICHPSLTGGQWHMVEQKMATIAGDCTMDLETERETAAASAIAMSWLRLLTGCGYTELGVDLDGKFLFRWHRPPGSLFSDCSVKDGGTGKLFVQADYEILIPPDVPNAVKFMAARVTERVLDDRMTVYRLTKESVAQAAEAGIRPEQLAVFLKEHAAAEIPEHVLTALFQWGKMTERSDMVDQEVSEEVHQLRWKSWHQMGNQSTGLIRPTCSELKLRADDMLDPFLSPPDLSHIPKMWTSDWRIYHRSTAKQMMEQALVSSAKVEIAIKGSRMEFIPLHLEHQPWKISGVLYDPNSEKAEAIVTLGEGEWKEMRLVIP